MPADDGEPLSYDKDQYDKWCDFFLVSILGWCLCKRQIWSPEFFPHSRAMLRNAALQEEPHSDHL